MAALLLLTSLSTTTSHAGSKGFADFRIKSEDFLPCHQPVRVVHLGFTHPCSCPASPPSPSVPALHHSASCPAPFLSACTADRTRIHGPDL